MKKIVERFRDISILIIGDIMLDQYVWGRVRRISPEAPVPVVEVVREEFRIGGAGNVANNITSLGAKAFIAAVAGGDSMQTLLRDMVRGAGIDDGGLFIEDERPTSLKTRIIAHNQQVVRIDREKTDEIKPETVKRIMEYIEMILPEIDGIIISDYAKGVVTKDMVEDIVRLAGSTHFIAVDPKIGHFDYYRDVDLITPNKAEASHGANIEIADERSLIEAGKIIMDKLHCSSLLITRGEEGMSLFEHGGKVTHIPTSAKKVYDVTGAGDTVIATFVLSKCAGANMKESAIIANCAAGIVVGQVGTATVTDKMLIENL
ncbi:MAG: D-glycero-beta-D-manno-heptose-7-phosphate kinase [Nitrospirae bacterium]|nr:MAG: D-glycero-beta-D-manno-heptose-7-phosphate kinase [Nitrospirota bacterium]